MLLCVFVMPMKAQGWPEAYGGVILQGFSWDSYNATKWTVLTSQAEDLSYAFDLIWIPNAANCGSGNQMGYSPLYWFTNYSSSFGTKAELQSMVAALKANGIGVIGDVVVNHRKNVSNWTDFPSETYNGVTYQLTASDICSDDDGGATANHLQSGESLGNADTGTGWSGMRDLDHTSTNVQNNVKAYVKMLLDDLGYVGFRYDMVLGYAPTYTAMYNAYANPQFSIGECWDTADAIKDWIDGTAVGGSPTSAAFDFQFRYTVRNAINGNDWTKLSQANTGSGGYPLVSNSFNSGGYKRYAVTFVENHDTQDRGAVTGYSKDPIVSDTLAANAYMLAMPGTPCVFQPHWLAYPTEIKTMVAARKAAGVTNTSSYRVVSSSANRYVISTTGTKSSLIAAVGSNLSGYTGPSNTTLVAEGYHYKYFMSNNANVAWTATPSGSYREAFDVKLTAVSSQYTTIAYTLDGSEPTASSPTVSSGSTITISDDAVLKAALVSGSSIVSGSTMTRVYKVQAMKDITVYFKAPTGIWSDVYFYAWDSSSSPLGSWPGTKITQTTTVHGDTFYYYTLSSTDLNYSFNLIVGNGGSGNGNQTVNITGVSQDIYLELGTQNGKYNVNDVTEQYSTPLTATVYFKDPGWSTVNYYAWDDNGSSLLGSWPGTAITEKTTVDGVSYYYHTFVKDTQDYTFNVIFNNGDGTQTVDIKGITDDVYYELLGQDASGKYLVGEVGSTFTPYNVTVYFKDPEWSTVNFYSWDSSGSPLLGGWPGTEITDVVYIDGEPWYYYPFTIDYEGKTINVIFNNGTNQTVDIKDIDSDVYYELGELSSGKYQVTDAGDMTEQITGVTLSEESVRLDAGETLSLSALVSGVNVRSDVVWTSSNENVVKVTGGSPSPVRNSGPRRSASVGGNVEAVGDGSATITASVGEFSAICAVTVGESTDVSDLAVPSVTARLSGENLIIHSSEAAKAQIVLTNGTWRTVDVNPGANVYPVGDAVIVIVKIGTKAMKLTRK